MNRPSRKLVALLVLGLIAAGVWLFMRSTPDTSDKQPAAHVDHVVGEASLNTITLTQETEQRLGIKVEPVTMKSIRRMRLYGGEIITPVGRRGVVTAPFGGILKAPDDGVPAEGDQVKKGQTIFTLLPLLTVEARSTSATAQVDADMQVKNAATQLNTARAALERARQLYADKVGARRGVEEAQAAYDIAAKTLEAARARQSLLEESLNEGTAAPIAIAAPEDGILRRISAAHGQNVPGGTSLFEMGDLTTAWVRVSLPMGDLEDIARDADAEVGSLSARADTVMQPAMAVAAPPIANPQMYTIDLLYVLHNAGSQPIPGQRVGVMLPLNDDQESLTLPASAVVFDALGGSWVYEQTAPLMYARKRVTVSYVTKDTAVLASGPASDTPVITVGAQALFGAETGTLK